MKKKDENIEELSCPYHGRIEFLEEGVKKINSTCCSQQHMEQRVKTNMLLQQLIEQFETLKNDIKNQDIEIEKKYITTVKTLQEELRDLKASQEQFKRYFNYLAGAVFVIYFLGLDKKIKILLGG